MMDFTELGFVPVAAIVVLCVLVGLTWKRADRLDGSAQSMIDAANARFVHPTRQEMAVLCLDSGGALLHAAVRDWDIMQDFAGARWIVEQAVDSGAHQLALVWKRYASARSLTKAELSALASLVALLSILELRVNDFILLHPSEYISLRQTGKLVDAAPGSLALAADDESGDFIMEGCTDFFEGA